jgi:hypothetical protein
MVGIRRQDAAALEVVQHVVREAEDAADAVAGHYQPEVGHAHRRTVIRKGESALGCGYAARGARAS